MVFSSFFSSSQSVRNHQHAKAQKTVTSFVSSFVLFSSSSLLPLRTIHFLLLLLFLPLLLLRRHHIFVTSEKIFVALSPHLKTPTRKEDPNLIQSLIVTSTDTNGSAAIASSQNLSDDMMHNKVTICSCLDRPTNDTSPNITTQCRRYCPPTSICHCDKILVLI